MKSNTIPAITILAPAGRLQLDVMKEVHRLAAHYSLGVYLTTAQNLRLTDIPADKVDAIKESLAVKGAEFKAPGKFPLPRVCVGERHCSLGIIDTTALSERITSTFTAKKKTKAKFKIAVSGCTLCCSGPKTTDLGIVATREGYELYAGGKGGPYPRIGKRIGKNLSEDKVLEMLVHLVEYHDAKTLKKQRFAKIVDFDDFPYSEV